MMMKKKMRMMTLRSCETARLLWLMVQRFSYTTPR